jgi:molecular chaperone GrpE
LAKRRASRRTRSAPPVEAEVGETTRKEATEASPSLDDSELTTALAEALRALPSTDAAEGYRERARVAERQLSKVSEAYRQLKDENEVFRQRMTRNIQRAYDERRERLLLKFIDILDNLDRALEAAERSYVTEPLIEGLILVRSQLLQTLQDEGLERVPVLGLPYDPSIAEAVHTDPVDDPEQHDVVLKELLRSYRFEDRIIRAGHVVVGQRPNPPGATPLRDTEPTEGASREANGRKAGVEEVGARHQAQEGLVPGRPGAAPEGDEE